MRPVQILSHFPFYEASVTVVHASWKTLKPRCETGLIGGRQMGLLIFDRQADIGFWFYLPSLHRVESLMGRIFAVTKGQKHSDVHRWRGCGFNNLSATTAPRWWSTQSGGGGGGGGSEVRRCWVLLALASVTQRKKFGHILGRGSMFALCSRPLYILHTQ